MLELRQVRDQPEAVERALAGKGGAEHVKDIVAHDAARRRLIKEADELKALRNRASEAIGQARKRGEDAAAERAQMREVGERIKVLDNEVKEVDGRI
ncbi:MAG: serine--tRNA ligase, partial [Candidatus Rokuibacteriota bacterium]